MIKNEDSEFKQFWLRDRDYVGEVEEVEEEDKMQE